MNLFVLAYLVFGLTVLLRWFLIRAYAEDETVADFFNAPFFALGRFLDASIQRCLRLLELAYSLLIVTILLASNLKLGLLLAWVRVPVPGTGGAVWF